MQARPGLAGPSLRSKNLKHLSVMEHLPSVKSVLIRGKVLLFSSVFIIANQ
jgi:hypothetical protein